jgi:hypothetical protein
MKDADQLACCCLKEAAWPDCDKKVDTVTKMSLSQSQTSLKISEAFNASLKPAIFPSVGENKVFYLSILGALQ